MNIKCEKSYTNSSQVWCLSPRPAFGDFEIILTDSHCKILTHSEKKTHCVPIADALFVVSVPMNNTIKGCLQFGSAE